MANFNAHVQQFESNIKLLEKLSDYNTYWDWKVTITFYSSLHLINAHLAKKANLHYQSHKQTDDAINFANPLSPCKVEEDVYVAYKSLQNLSKRSRYLVKESKGPDSDQCFLTYDRHFEKALRQLDVILDYFLDNYKRDFEIDKIRLKCPMKNNLKHIEIIN